MKKIKYYWSCIAPSVLGIVPLTILIGVLVSGCSQTGAKYFGNETTIKLDPGQKLEVVDWEEDNLWYLTKPMTEFDIPETHTFKRSTNFGVIEGSVIFIESVE